MIELVIGVSVFFALILGLTEFGRMVMVAQILTNAAREGARVAILPGSTDQTCKSTVTSYLENCSVKTEGYAAPTVSPSTNAAASGTPITVTVSVPFDEVSWITPTWLTGTNLSAQVVMIKE